MIKIYGQALSRAPRCTWALEEMGVPYELVPVNPMAGEGQRPEYLAINPNGKVPAMVDGDLKLFESMAINLYLARKYGKGLWPASDADQARVTQWSFWGMTEIEPPLIMLIVQKMMPGEGGPDQKRIEEAMNMVPRPLKVLDAHLADRQYLLGDKFTIADLNLASVFSIAPFVGLEFPEYPKVEAWLKRCFGREGFRRANPPPAEAA